METMEFDPMAVARPPSAALQAAASAVTKAAARQSDIAAAGVYIGQSPSIQFLLRRESWPLPNVWLGVSVEDQKRADERIPILLDTPAAIRWISAEPLLGPVNLRAALLLSEDNKPLFFNPPRNHIDWVVAGGESGPGARPMHPDWARYLRDQCKAACVPFLFKQWGEWVPHGPPSVGYKVFAADDRSSIDYSQIHGRWMARVGKTRAGRLLDGIDHDEFPVTGR